MNFVDLNMVLQAQISCDNVQITIPIKDVKHIIREEPTVKKIENGDLYYA